MIWWMWLLAGLGLLIVEMVTPGGFFAFFFGASAIVVGILSAAHLAGPDWMEWALFTGLSVLGVLIFRRPLMQRFGMSAPAFPVDELKGEWATVTEEIRPGDFGKVELRGAAWTARANRTVHVGERVQVERIEGLTVWLANSESRGGWSSGGGST